MNIVWINEFTSLRDYIVSSDIETLDSLMTQEELQEAQSMFGDVISLIASINSLPRNPQKTFNVLDYDDTISCREWSFDKFPELLERRGSAWNEYIEQELWYEKYVERVYGEKDRVAKLVNVLLSSDPYTDSLILSAGIDELQWYKFSRTWLAGAKKQVVSSQAEKPRRLLHYIISKLWYIPGKIIIYEDRPDCFLECGDLLAKILGVEIVVNHVHLSGEDYNSIDSIKQTIIQ